MFITLILLQYIDNLLGESIYGKNKIDFIENKLD